MIKFAQMIATSVSTSVGNVVADALKAHHETTVNVNSNGGKPVQPAQQSQLTDAEKISKLEQLVYKMHQQLEDKSSGTAKNPEVLKADPFSTETSFVRAVPQLPGDVAAGIWATTQNAAYAKAQVDKANEAINKVQAERAEARRLSEAKWEKTDDKLQAHTERLDRHTIVGGLLATLYVGEKLIQVAQSTMTPNAPIRIG